MSTDAKQSFDYWLLGSVLTLVSAGIVMVYSASAVLALDRYGDASYFLKRQILFAAVGLGVLIVITRMNYSFWQKAAYPLLILCFLALTLVLIPRFGLQAEGGVVGHVGQCKLLGRVAE